jgi:diguanylate cyclase (GGDEF)-like protein
MWSGKNQAMMIWPLALLSLGLIMLLVLGTTTLIAQFDGEAIQREQELVANGLADRVNEVGAKLVPQVVWGEAVLKLDTRFDPNFAKESILGYLTQTAGFSSAFVLDPQDQLLIGWDELAFVSSTQFKQFSAQAAPLLAAIRRDEIARNAARSVDPTGTVNKAPISHSEIVLINRQPHILTAARVQPDDGSTRLRGIHAPVVLAAMPINDTFLSELSSRYLLKRLELTQAPSKVATERAFVPLNGPTGKEIAVLSWSPQNPGMALLKKLAPWILPVVGLLVWLAFGLLRRSNRMAESLIASEARAAHLAYHDSLTGLPNRVLFNDRLGLAVAQLRRKGPSVAVLCLDFDRFKEVNDTYGHHIGDKLIKEAARRMAAQCRVTDTIARLSGDEFAIVKLGGVPGDAAALAERLCAIVSEPFEFGSARLYIGCTVGITIVVDPDIETAEILRQADIALYRGKEEAKGQFRFFEPEMDVAIRTRKRLETDLREAIAHKQLRLAYQPQVNTKGHITGVEALLRWDHAEQGCISPSYFVPIAEQCGLILDLGLFALRQAFTDSARWPALRVAINISAAQIRDKGFISKLRELVTEIEVTPGNFELEITEGVLLGDDPDIQQCLSEIRAMGFGLALDDFGTGYSSLSYLHRYPINTIKIDRSFIANLGVESESDAVVGAIIKLAKALQLAVIAEGVETAAQLAHLVAAGCSNMQGYLFSEAVTAHAIDQLYHQRRIDAKSAGAGTYARAA